MMKIHTQSAVGCLRLAPELRGKATQLLDDVVEWDIGELSRREWAWLKGTHTKRSEGGPTGAVIRDEVVCGGRGATDNNSGVETVGGDRMRNFGRSREPRLIGSL